jgi:oxygen-independent coproporphyrinogen-3 oxidase
VRECIDQIQSLYIHVPFCAQKCSYCAFYSEASSGELINRYVQAVIREMEMVADDLHPKTVFFGGGTPSILNLKQWRQILESMDRLGLLGAQEWTVECNPATVSLDKAKLLRDFGVNRISMGVQSLDEALLDRLGRVHTRDMVFKSFDILRKAGFGNLNVDLMFAIPGQTLEIWSETLGEAVALGSEHLSSYEVIYEEDTALYAQLQAGEFAVNEDLACAMYDVLLEHAAAAGLHQYEIANFARDARFNSQHPVQTAPRLKERERMSSNRDKTAFVGVSTDCRSILPLPGGEGRGEGKRNARPRDPAHFSLPRFSCRHNVNYWRGGSFHGLGPSATSYVRGLRTKNWANTQMYCDLLSKGRRPIESREELSPVGRAGEIAAFGLRMPVGWSFGEFQSTTGFDLRREWRREMTELEDKGWAAISRDRFHLTPAGLRFADSAAELFLR